MNIRVQTIQCLESFTQMLFTKRPEVDAFTILSFAYNFSARGRVSKPTWNAIMTSGALSIRNHAHKSSCVAKSARAIHFYQLTFHFTYDTACTSTLSHAFLCRQGSCPIKIFRRKLPSHSGHIRLFVKLFPQPHFDNSRRLVYKKKTSSRYETHLLSSFIHVTYALEASQWKETKRLSEGHYILVHFHQKQLLTLFQNNPVDQPCEYLYTLRKPATEAAAASVPFLRHQPL